MKILICGAGSIGIYLGVKLYKEGHEITLHGRRKLKELEKSIYINDQKFIVPKKIFSITRKQQYDFIFITAKLYDLEEILKELKEKEVRTKILVSIQNGLVDPENYKKYLGKKRLVILSVFEGFKLSDKKLTANQTKMGWKVEDSIEGKKISKVLKESGINCKVEKDLDVYRAEKTIVNCCLNGLSAIENKPFKNLFDREETKKRIEEIFKECYQILSKEYKLDSKDKLKKRMYNNWSKMNHYSSLCQDIQSKRDTEIDFLNGYILKLGKKYNLKTKENEKIVKEVKEKQRIQ